MIDDAITELTPIVGVRAACAAPRQPLPATPQFTEPGPAAAT